MCYYIITKEKSPVTRVSDHFFTNTSYKGCTLFVRRIRLLSFGTASGHIMYTGYDPPALQVRNMILGTVFMGFFFYAADAKHLPHKKRVRFENNRIDRYIITIFQYD